MSLAALAAAATVYDDIEAVANDAKVSVPMARAVVAQCGIASVSDDGVVTMSERQSQRAAAALVGAGRAW